MVWNRGARISNCAARRSADTFASFHQQKLLPRRHLLQNESPAVRLGPLPRHGGAVRIELSQTVFQ